MLIERDFWQHLDLLRHGRGRRHPRGQSPVPLRLRRSVAV